MNDEERRVDELNNTEESPPQEKASASNSERDLPSLLSELQEASRERTQFKSLAQRVQADFINYRKRVQEEQKEQLNNATSRIILRILPVLDDFKLAVDHAAQTETVGPWLEGMRMIQRKLEGLLESEGVSQIRALGKAFDPFEHEALAYREDTAQPEGQVVMVIRDGYKLNGRVIRPAQVVVTKKTTELGDMPTEGAREKEA